MVKETVKSKRKRRKRRKMRTNHVKHFWTLNIDMLVCSIVVSFFSLKYT